MKRRVGVVCESDFLFQKIYLILKPHTTVLRGDDGDICLWDLRMGDAPSGARSYVTLGRGGDIPIPFDDESLLSVLDGNSGAPLRLGDRCAILRGREIRLTDVEFNTLSVLFTAGGSFVSRDEIVGAVWGDGVDGGVLNVYIHYLREKLEGEGEKIIISSRKLGYKIDEKYLLEVKEQC